MSKKIYIAAVMILLLVLAAYFFLGGFKAVDVKETGPLSFRVVGSYFHGRYDDKQLERNFLQARKMVVEDSVRGTLCVVTYQPDSLNEDFVSQFIGVALNPGEPMSGSLFDLLPNDVAARVFNSQGGGMVRLDMHPMVKPNPQKIQGKLAAFSTKNGWAPRKYFVELYLPDNSTEVYVLK